MKENGPLEIYSIHTELNMTEWKSKVQISSSSQSSIAEMKNFLVDGRLTSSPPLPPHHTHSGAPTDHPYTHSIPTRIPIGAVCG